MVKDTKCLTAILLKQSCRQHFFLSSSETMNIFPIVAATKKAVCKSRMSSSCRIMHLL